MRIIGQIGTLAVVAASLVAPAVAQQAAPMQHDMAGMSMPAGDSPADKAMMAGMSKMQQDMATAPLTGDPDKDFVAMMLPHHAGAVDMAKVELKYGKDPEMRKLAKAIVAGQSKQEAEMTAWQKRHRAK
jgi:uncharacterized protein (DUF305 family)